MRAAFVETGRVLRLDAWRMAFLQSVFACMILMPFFPFMRWPDDGWFYVGAVGVALIMTIGTLIQLLLTGEKHGRVSGIAMPLEALIGYLIWVALMPGHFRAYDQDMLHIAGIAIAFILASFAMLYLRPHDAKLRTFMVVAPVGFTYAIAGVVTKMIMPMVDILPMALSYALVNFTVMAAMTGLALITQKKFDGLGTRECLSGGLLGGAFSAGGYMAFIMAIIHARNPGYVSMVAMLLPVWLMLWHKARRQEDTASPMAAFIILISVVMLVLAAM
jgi:hypothetical protein